MIRPNADFASRANLSQIEDLFERWEADPASVDPDWQAFFAGFRLGVERFDEEGDPVVAGEGQPATAASSASAAEPGKAPGRVDQQKVDSLIYAYRDIGHTVCELDPLGRDRNAYNPLLEIERFGLAESDLDRHFASASIPGMPDRAPLRDIVATLRDTYCGTCGVEYLHIQDPTRRQWLKDHIEPIRNTPQLTREERSRILYKICQAEQLENFIHTKFLGQKRFSLEGGEALIPAMDALVELGGELGIKEVVMGMAHRGRLNVLANILNKSYEELFAEFGDTIDHTGEEGDGDVKYHMGFSSWHLTSNGRKIHLTLTANPSHLEAVNPVVAGRVRGKQRQQDDTLERKRVVPLLIHGDAAFAGQGLVMECLQMSQLEGYTTGGTVHIVLNNQIGFTTLPEDSRSTRYCTDLAKMIDAPVWHVNGDDPEAVVHAIRMAMEYRHMFGADVFVDLVCYRRHGHNETDEPNYTQPTMYAIIAAHPRPSEIYTKVLLERDDLDQAEIDGIARIMKNQLTDALETVKTGPTKKNRTRFQGQWQGMKNHYSHDPVDTAVPAQVLEKIGVALSSWPESFNIHPKIKRLAEDRGRIVAEHGDVDWALAELLSIGSLLTEGTPVRLSGQDCRRGTFSQRHSYWYDVNTRERFKPLNQIQDDQANFCVYNSLLSEAAVLGFDYGYSISEPNMLIIWEAQFGDFANGAQVMIDQFISSSESKWERFSGLVMMLPHGQEGMGPEHSSARLERYLQSCADDNMQVVYCSTAAQHFHLLRRQVMRSFRKPLICMTPKGHLRSKAASSSFEELTNGSFHEILDDPTRPLKGAKRVVLCTGKVAHDLIAKRDAEKLKDVAIVRFEQLYPWPEPALNAFLADLKKVKEVVWAQEEPQNMGAWFFVDPHLRAALGRDVPYVGRSAAASPATGRASEFKRSQACLVETALGIFDGPNIIKRG